MLRIVDKRVPCVQQTQTVYELDIALLEVEPKRELLGEVVHGIEGFSLGLADDRNIRAALLCAVPSKVSARVLDDNVGLRVVEQRTSRVSRVAAEAAHMKMHVSREIERPVKQYGQTYLSSGHGSESTWSRSGRAFASSLYTRAPLAIRLVPPSLAVCSASRAIKSPTSVWKTCASVVYAAFPNGFPSFPAVPFPCVSVRSLMCASTEPKPSCFPRADPTCDAMPAYIIAISSRLYLSTGRVRKTKKPRPK